MSNPEKLTVHVSRKVQLEQFEPITFGGTVEVELEEGDDYTEEYEAHSDELAAAVDKALTKRATDAKYLEEYGDE